MKPELQDSLVTSSERTFGPREWTALFAAFSDSLEWALSRAGRLAEANPLLADEVAVVHRVREFIRKRIDGDPAHVRADDLLFTLGLIAGALERDVMPHVKARRVRGAGHKSNRAPRIKRAPRRHGAVAVARDRWVN